MFIDSVCYYFFYLYNESQCLRIILTCALVCFRIRMFSDWSSINGRNFCSFTLSRWTLSEFLYHQKWLHFTKLGGRTCQTVADDHIWRHNQSCCKTVTYLLQQWHSVPHENVSRQRSLQGLLQLIYYISITLTYIHTVVVFKYSTNGDIYQVCKMAFVVIVFFIWTNYITVDASVMFESDIYFTHYRILHVIFRYILWYILLILVWEVYTGLVHTFIDLSYLTVSC